MLEGSCLSFQIISRTLTRCIIMLNSKCQINKRAALVCIVIAVLVTVIVTFDRLISLTGLNPAGGGIDYDAFTKHDCT